MKLLIECLKESFTKYADKTAYIDRSGSRMTTYGQLDELSGKIAAGIIEQGCKKGDIIPVLMPRCTEYIAAEIGIMKAGCVFAPLITDYPQDRIEYIKKECKSRFVVDKAFVNDYGQNYLVEYFKGDGVTAEKIKEHLHTVLPDYMIPLFFVKVDEFPLNANGKIDRLALKEPDASMFKTDYVPPESETEKLLCEKFEEVLNCGKVGIKDSFFDLGGDSIKVIKLQSICNISKLSTKIIFDGKTPENIAVLLENTADEEIYDILSDYPLTQTQNGIFVECAANPGTTIYNIPCLYKLGKNVDLNKLKSAVESTINAHPYIKTKLFLNENGDIRAKRNDKEKPIVNSLFQALIKSLSFHLLTLQPQQLCALPEQTVSLLFIMPATDTELKWETL